MESSIFKKLMNVQSALKANKSRFNKFGGFSYRSAEDILEAVKPLLKENGLVLICSDTLTDGCITATYRLIDVESGAEVSNSALAVIGEHKGMSAEQNTGCASSYARKYALNGLFAIDDSTSDPDSMNNTQESKAVKRNMLLEAKRSLMKIFNDCGIKNTNDIKELVGIMGIDTTNEQSINEFLQLENVQETIKSALERMCNKYI